MRGNNSLKQLLGELFTSPLFLTVLIVKVLLATFLIGNIASARFLPFLQYFGSHPFTNPYQHFADLGVLNAFPYPPLMLLIMGLPFMLFSFLGHTGVYALDSFLLRAPLLLADIAILIVLLLFNPKRKKLVLLLYWLSPVIIYATYVQGFLDIIPTAILLIALYLLWIERPVLSAITLGLGFATKSHLLLVTPFIAIYVWKREKRLRNAIVYGLTALAVYLLCLAPYVTSPGFILLVFKFQEQFRIFDLSIQFGDVLFYITIAIYGYLVFKAYSFRRITNDLLLLLISLTFTLFVTLIKPGAGWYIWSVPFIVYFFAKEKEENLLYWASGGLYVAYFFLTAGTDILSASPLVGSVVAALSTPLSIAGVSITDSMPKSILFTLLSANLLYIAYLMYKNGIKKSQLFQDEGGIPVIGIAGDSGSGKTTLANALARLFGEKHTTVLCGDDVHKWERGDKHWEQYTHLNPLSNKIHQKQKQIATLKTGKSILRSMYDHDVGKFTAPQYVEPKSIIIDEGLHTFVIGSQLYTLKIYQDPDERLRFYEKVRRDAKERGHSKEHVIQTMEKRKPDAQKYILPQRDEADVIISVQLAGTAVPQVDTSADKGLKIEFLVRADIHLDPLLDALETNTKLNIQQEYINNKFQRVFIEGNATKEELRLTLENLDIDLIDFSIDTTAMLPSLTGLMQLFSLYCFYERLVSTTGKA